MTRKRYLELLHKWSNYEINIFKDYNERIEFYKILYKEQKTSGDN